MHLRKIYGEVSQQSPISEKDIQRPNRRLKAQEVQPKYVKRLVELPHSPALRGEEHLFGVP